MAPTGTASPQAPNSPLRQRRSVSDLDADQLGMLRDAFAAVLGFSDDRGYQFHAGIHGLPLPKYCNLAHGKPTFLAWHRAYLYTFEMALRDQVPEVTLPWWDWRVLREVPAAYGDKQQADGTPNPLYSVHINDEAISQGHNDPDEQADHVLAGHPDTFRQPGRPGAAPLPTADEIEALLNRSQFLDFQSELEDYHGTVHVWVGGHMSDIPYAAYDPIFWAHHSMIDWIWRLWQLRHAHTALPGWLLNSPLSPFELTFSDVLTVTNLGYDYAAITADDPGGH